MGKDIDLNVRVSSEQAKKSFDGLNVSVKELHQRIRDLDAQALKLKETYGKVYRDAPQFARIDRERKLALEQLIATEAKQETQARKSTRGIGSLASAATAAMGSISGLSTGISTLTYALMSGVGLTAGLAAAVVGFSVLMDYLRGANEEFEKLKGMMSGLIDVKMPGGTIKISPEKIPDMMKRLEQQRNELSRSERYLYELEPKGMTNLEEKAQRTVDSYNAMIEVLDETHKKYIDMKNAMTLLTDAGFEFSEKTKESLPKLKEWVDYYKFVTTRTSPMMSNQDIALLNRAGTTETKGLMFGTGGDIGGMPIGGTHPFLQNEAKMKEMEQQRERMNQQFSERTSQVFAHNMIQAWQNIFGEANSMFEQLLASWSSLLLEQVGSGLFSMIFGGFDFFGFARSITGGNTTARKYRMGK